MVTTVKRFKKSLGQNFLVDANIQRKITQACALTENDCVLEIGAGKGALTRMIGQRVKQLYALEIDQLLCQALSRDFAGLNNIKIIHADILKFDISALTELRLKVIGNIPYYISSPIIERLIGFRKKISDIYITVQNEFARRACAPSGSKEYGSFSCFVQYYCKCSILFTITKNCFYPVPKVDSAFMHIHIRSNSPFKLKDEGLFFKTIRAAFSHRRKTLRNSLDGVVTKEALEKFFSSTKIREDIRPEMLSLEDFAALANTASL